MAIIQLISDEVPPAYRPSIDLNGDLLPSVYFETTYLEDTAGVAIVSTNAQSPPILLPGIVNGVTKTVQQINITLHPVSGVTDEETLFHTPSTLVGTGISVNSIPGTNSNGYTLVLVGPATTQHFVQVLQGVFYRNRAQEPDNTQTRRIEFTASNDVPLDNFPKSYTTVTISKVNDAPIVDLDVNTPGNDALHYTQDLADPIRVFPNMSITDSDSQVLQQVDILFTPIDGNFERFGIDAALLRASGLQRIDADDGTGLLFLIGQASLTTYTNLLKTVTWQNTKADRNTTTGWRNITVKVYDHAGRIAAIPTAAVFFQSFDDAPIVQLNSPSFDFATSYTEEAPPVRLTGVVNVTDPDTLIVYVIGELRNAGTNPTDVLSIIGSLPSGLTWNFWSASATLNISGVAHTSVYIQALQRVFYSNTAAEPDSSYVRVFDVWAVDTTSVSSRSVRNVTANVTLRSLNDNSPVIQPCNGSVVENSPNGTQVTVVQASDSDFGIDGVLRYWLVSVSPQPSPFKLDPVTGQLS